MVGVLFAQVSVVVRTFALYVLWIPVFVSIYLSSFMLAHVFMDICFLIRMPPRYLFLGQLLKVVRTHASVHMLMDMDTCFGQVLKVVHTSAFGALAF